MLLLLRLSSLANFSFSSDNYNAVAATRAGPRWVGRSRDENSGLTPTPPAPSGQADQTERG